MHLLIFGSCNPPRVHLNLGDRDDGLVGIMELQSPKGTSEPRPRGAAGLHRPRCNPPRVHLNLSSVAVFVFSGSGCNPPRVHLNLNSKISHHVPHCRCNPPRVHLNRLVGDDRIRRLLLQSPKGTSEPIRILVGYAALMGVYG